MNKSFSLRTKVLGAIAAALLLLFVLQYFIARNLLFNGFSHLEQTRAESNLQLVRGFIQQDLSNLTDNAQDYADWDEMISYVKSRSKDFEKDNFSLQTYNNLKFNVAIVTDVKGNIIFEKTVDWENKKPLTTSAQLLANVTGTGRLWKHDTPTSQFTGIIVLPETPALIASFPILDSNAAGPVHGTLIMVRYLDKSLINSFLSATKSPLKLTPITETLPADVAQLYKYLKDNRIHIDTSNTEYAVASSLLSDIFGEPALIYSVNIQRDIYAKVVSTTDYLFWTSLAVFTFLGLISLLFDRLVIQRITKLTKQMSELKDFTATKLARLPVSGGSDELSNLTGSLNTMLARIENSMVERKHAEDRIHLLAHYDQLTHLPNRILLSSFIDKAIAEAKKSGSQFAILFMDLDRFKNINDSIGHQAGDELLSIVADRLRAFMGGRALVSRLGGDEFVVLLPDLFNIEQVEAFAKRLVTMLNRICVIKGQEVSVSTSVGISLYPNDGEDIDTLIRNADTAMYRAKERGGNTYVSYSKHMNIAAVERLQLEVNLRHAINRDELQVQYQPVADLVSGHIISAEALLRWQHAEYGYVSPSKFIPIAEETGQIYKLGEWVLRAVCKQLRIWLDENISVVPIAVNISVKQLQNKNYYADVLAILREFSIPTSLIVFELTESVVMADDDVEAAAVLPQLQAAGIRIAIDDFGTGFSSFSRLHKCPIDILKIDQSFIRRIHDSDSSANIIKAMISMAKALSIRVVAEGVETEQQSEFLRRSHCDAVQGYYISKSQPTSDFTNQLRNQAQRGDSVIIPKPRTQPVSIMNGDSNGGRVTLPFAIPG